MPKHYFFQPDIPPEGEEKALNFSESRHAVKVLRLKEGNRVGLLDGEGTKAEAEVSGINGSGKRLQVSCKIIVREFVEPPTTKVCLFVAMTKAKQMSLIFKQATELGVWEITPVLCENSVANVEENNVKPHWKEDITVAVKQSRNPFCPVLNGVSSFENALKSSCEYGFFGDLGAPEESVHGYLSPCPAKIALWIGPEGGFSAAEKYALIGSGYRGLVVGPNVLRVETAVTATLGWFRGAGVG